MTKGFDFENFTRNMNRLLKKEGYTPLNVKEASHYARKGLSPRKAADEAISEANQYYGFEN